MADVHCGSCGSARTNTALADAVGCDDCGAATRYDGTLAHGPTKVFDVPAEPVDEPEAKAAPKRTSAKSTKKG